VRRGIRWATDDTENDAVVIAADGTDAIATDAVAAETDGTDVAAATAVFIVSHEVRALAVADVRRFQRAAEIGGLIAAHLTGPAAGRAAGSAAERAGEAAGAAAAGHAFTALVID
jgi:hypothetical protein